MTIRPRNVIALMGLVVLAALAWLFDFGRTAVEVADPASRGDLSTERQEPNAPQDVGARRAEPDGPVGGASRMPEEVSLKKEREIRASSVRSPHE